MGLIIDGVGPMAAPFIKIDDTRTVVLAQGNGTTNFGKVLAGTTIGLVTATDKGRPCGQTKADQAQSGVTEIDVDDATNFFVGDTINCTSLLGVAGAVTIDADGAGTGNLVLTSKSNDGLAHRIILADVGGVLGTVAPVVTAGAVTITFTSILEDGLNHDVILLDPAGNTQPLFGKSVITAGGVETVTISLATDGGGAITSTVNQVIAEFNATSQTMRAVLTAAGGGDTVIALASTALVGEVAGEVVLNASSSIASTGIETLTINLGHSGGAVTSLVSAVLGLINASAVKFTAAYEAGAVGTNLAVAVASTPLAGGVALGASILSAQAITAVDKTSAQHTITTAANVTVADDDPISLSNGADTCIGLTDVDYTTFTGHADEDGAVVYADRTGVTVVLKGRAYRASCTGLNTHLEADLDGDISFM